MLELNTEDNTGARYLLAAVYLYSNQLDQAEQLLEEYGRGDAATAFAYDKIILEYKKNGITSQLKMLYRVARGVNKHVPDYLLGLKRLPHNLLILSAWATPTKRLNMSLCIPVYGRARRIC